MKNQIILNSIYTCAISIFFLKSNIIKSIYRYDPNNKYLMTAFFGLFIFLAIFNAVNARTYRINTFANLLKNRVFIFIILFVAIVQIILIYYGGDIFRTTGLTIYDFEFMFSISAGTNARLSSVRVKHLEEEDIDMSLGAYAIELESNTDMKETQEKIAQEQKKQKALDKYFNRKKE